MLTAGPQVQLWRAPIDNDVHLAKDWIKAEYHALVPMVRDVSLKELHEGRVVLVRISGAIGAKGSGPLFATTLEYAVYGTGDVMLTTRITPRVKQLPTLPRGGLDRPGMEAQKEGLPPLPRRGLQLSMPPSFDRIAWYGRGPHECYEDRKESGKLGIYSGSVEEQFVPYIKPQENGNKLDVRWAAITDSRGIGLLVSGSPVFNLSAHFYSTEELTRAKHLHDLQRRNETIVHLDDRQSGIGNHSCGYAPTLQQYLIPAEEQASFTLRLRPFSSNILSPARLAGQLPESTDGETWSREMKSE